jgi:hypothetical protein
LRACRVRADFLNLPRALARVIAPAAYGTVLVD